MLTTLKGCCRISKSSPSSRLNFKCTSKFQRFNGKEGEGWNFFVYSDKLPSKIIFVTAFFNIYTLVQHPTYPSRCRNILDKLKILNTVLWEFLEFDTFSVNLILDSWILAESRHSWTLFVKSSIPHWIVPVNLE